MASNRINIEIIAAATAMVVSIAALFVAWDQSVVMRAQQHASVWPVLQTDVTIDADDATFYLAFDVHNLGVGPALIKYADIQVNGQTLTSFDQFDEIILVPDLLNTRTIRSSSMSGIVGADQSRNILKISWEKTEKTAAAFAALAGKFSKEDSPEIDLILCYCSVFDKCWITNADNDTTPQEMASCPVREGDPIRRLVESI